MVMNSASPAFQAEAASGPPAPPPQTMPPRLSTAWRSSIRALCPPAVPSMARTVSPGLPPVVRSSDRYTAPNSARQSIRSAGARLGWAVWTRPVRDRTRRSSPRGGAPPPPAGPGPAVDRMTPRARGRTRHALEWGRTPSSKTRLSSIRPLGMPRVRARTARSTSMVRWAWAWAWESAASSPLDTVTPKLAWSLATLASTSLVSSARRSATEASSPACVWRRRRVSSRSR
mmetsp:Transcript_30995/g.90657  ORF Transcript_30995/g.90657 Transcript_30995/m.90657 type:complete len:230 (-) Transcript_30995:1045-1734(-)